MRLTPAQQSAIEFAERSIRKILVDLENDHDLEVEDVRVDTRNFAQMQTEIFVVGDDSV